MSNIERSPERLIVQVARPDRPPWRAWPMVDGGAVPESHEREYVRADLHRGAVLDRDALAGALAGAAAALEQAGYKTSAGAARAALARYGGQ